MPSARISEAYGRIENSSWAAAAWRLIVAARRAKELEMSSRTLPCALAASIAVLCGVAAPAAHADQLQDILQRKELRCGTLADIPPFATADARTRELVGFDVDMCHAVGKRLGVAVTLVPMSIEARIPEVKMGRVDIAIANLFYTLGRAQQIQFSNAYYLAKEVIMTRASEPGTTKADFKGKRLSASKGSTSEIGIRQNESEPLTFQDTGSAYMALMQNKAVGMVGNPLTLTKFIKQAKASGVDLKVIDDPLVVAPVAIGLRKDEPALLAAVNKALADMEKDGQINEIWSKWLGPSTEYQIARKETVTPISELKFTPAP
jgi:polar amino acid transport system substrate-binding protein